VTVPVVVAVDFQGWPAGPVPTTVVAFVSAKLGSGVVLVPAPHQSTAQPRP
jgi:hypothetical protein